MAFDEIQGYTSRVFLCEDHLNLVLAIKERNEISTAEAFQKFWKESRGNNDYLSINQLFNILSQVVAVSIFNNDDWINFNQLLYQHHKYFDKECIEFIYVVDAYLTTIDLMQMRYKND